MNNMLVVGSSLVSACLMNSTADNVTTVFCRIITRQLVNIRRESSNTNKKSPKCELHGSRSRLFSQPWKSLLYRVSRGQCARLRGNVPYVKVYRYNPKHLYPKLNGHGDNGERKVWSCCGSTYCTCFACWYPYTAHVRPSVSQPSQAHSDFIINRCHSYSEL